MSALESIKEFFYGPKKLQEYMKQRREKLVDHKGAPVIDNVPMKEEKNKMDDMDGCKRFRVGKDSTKPNRTILVLGATGAGKTTLINGMINYILGVKWEDSFRFKLVDEGQSKSQAESQTSEVTAYNINHQEGFKIDYSLTIVDTPGFGDTRGIDRDKEISEQLHRLFTAKHGVSDIDAVCFVAQASLARLTPTQRYVFDSVLSIFGKDIEENIRVLVTFADGQAPPVLEAIKASGVPCPKTKKGQPLHFKFNNSALFAANNSSGAHDEDDDDDDDDDDGSFDKMFWDMGNKSMEKFFKALTIINTKSLTLTTEVLKERQTLEITVDNLQKRVNLGLAKMEEKKQTSRILEKHEADIITNENFEYEVSFEQPIQVNKDGYNTNCQQCNTTCHYPCSYGNDKDKYKCRAMGSDGKCNQCPNKCHWSVHFNQKYNWRYETRTETRTYKNLQDKYQEAEQGKMSVQDMISKLTAEYGDLQLQVVQLMERSGKCLNRLKVIALKPNPLSTPEYIDLLIEGEKSECKPGYMDRIGSLDRMKQKALTMAMVEKGETFL